MMNKKMTLALVVVLVVVLTCKGTSGTPLTTTGKNSLTPSPALPHGTASITSTPFSSKTGPGTILFQDDFSDPNSGWLTNDQDLIALDYVDGGYRATVKKNYVASFSTFPNLQFDDVSIEADAKFLTGPNSSLFGLLCHATAEPDLQSVYEMLITPGGEASIVKVTGVKAGQEKVLTSGKSNLIHTGTATNHLRMDCSGDHISMYVNGQRLVQVQDSDYPRGRVGFTFGANYDPVFQVLFDNLIVHRQSRNVWPAI
jgi:hypothetical protein